MIDGRFECGPNAVLAFAREGYRKRDVNFEICLRLCLIRAFEKWLLVTEDGDGGDVAFFQ